MVVAGWDRKFPVPVTVMFMRILAVTNMYPIPEMLDFGTFVEQQIAGLRQIGLEVEVMFVDRIKRGMRAYLGLGPQIQARVRRFEPDLVHSMYGGVLAAQVTLAVNDRPTVVTFHGSDLLGENLSGTLRKVISRYGIWCSRRAAQRASGIIAVSKVLLDALPKQMDRSKIRVIPCGIDLERFKPLDQQSCRQRLGWEPGRFHILFPGSRDPVKRPALARAAVAAIKNREVRAEIHYLRGISNSEVPIWLNASDVVLLTSLHEGSPTIVKEALACNVPVVSVNVGDVAERIHGIEGCYIASSEPSDIAAKLSMVYGGSRRVSGRPKMQTLSLEQIANRLKDTYEEILAFPATNNVGKTSSDSPSELSAISSGWK
jgi:glycosyltransferase involved in cell wall biosynthesis